MYNPRQFMKKDLHPTDYRPVVFQDVNNDFAFLTRSTVATKDTIKWEDGNEYPLVKVHISSASHPFYTGQEKLVDVEGRVDRFKARQEAAKKRKEALAKKAQKINKKAESRQNSTTAQKIGDGKKPADHKKKPADKKSQTADVA